MALRALTVGLLYAGLATAQLRYADNQADLVKDSDEAAKHFPDVKGIQLESPAFTNPKSVPAGFDNGTSGPTDDATLGMLGNAFYEHSTDTSRLFPPKSCVP